DEIAEEISGRKQDTEGLERIRDLADSGKVEAVLVHKWNRLARTVARFESFILEMKLAGVDVVSLDGQSNATATGRMFNRMMAVFSEYQRDDLVATMRQGKIGRARIRGKVVPGRYAPYGFVYDKGTGNYRVDEGRMVHVRRAFRMVGNEGTTLRAVKTPFQKQDVPTPGGGRYWHPGTIREMICNDVYRAHGRGELERLVEAGNLSPEVLAGLERDQRYGIAWYNRTRWERTPDGEKAIRVTPNEKGDWIAVPVPDAGVPREWVDAARAATKDNVRSSRADQRSWELKGILFCPCGCRMVPYNSRRGGKRYHYYACGRYRREGPAACEHRKNWSADSLEGAVRRYVLALLRDPEVLRRQVRQSLRDEIAALRNPESKIRAWAGKLSEVDRVRLTYQRQQAEELMTLEELRAHLRDLDGRKAEAERELDALRDVRRRVDELRAYSDLVDGYLRDLPHLLHGKDEAVREHTHTEEHEEREREARAEGRLPLYPLSPGMFRERTPEEVEGLRLGRERERAERYRAMYTNLGLRIVAHKDGALELTWRAGEGVSQVCVSPRCTDFSAKSPAFRAQIDGDGNADVSVEL
ncbi:MAG: recombinase family protein, partial [Actinomycetota bacterium]|nr:recombinase family protein [Actinomycetota bacterium]